MSHEFVRLAPFAAGQLPTAAVHRLTQQAQRARLRHQLAVGWFASQRTVFLEQIQLKQARQVAVGRSHGSREAGAASVFDDREQAHQQQQQHGHSVGMAGVRQRAHGRQPLFRDGRTEEVSVIGAGHAHVELQVQHDSVAVQIPAGMAPVEQQAAGDVESIQERVRHQGLDGVVRQSGHVSQAGEECVVAVQERLVDDGGPYFGRQPAQRDQLGSQHGRARLIRTVE